MRFPVITDKRYHNTVRVNGCCLCVQISHLAWYTTTTLLLTAQQQRRHQASFYTSSPVEVSRQTNRMPCA